MSLAAVLRASSLSQPSTVTEIRYSSRNSTANDHAMIAGMRRNTSLPRGRRVMARYTTVLQRPPATPGPRERTPLIPVARASRRSGQAGPPRHTKTRSPRRHSPRVPACCVTCADDIFGKCRAIRHPQAGNRKPRCPRPAAQSRPISRSPGPAGAMVQVITNPGRFLYRVPSRGRG
jgi:hypothetical protein